MRRSARGIPVAEELAWAIVQRNPQANKHPRNSTRTAAGRSANRSQPVDPPRTVRRPAKPGPGRLRTDPRVAPGQTKDSY